MLPRGQDSVARGAIQYSPTGSPESFLRAQSNLLEVLGGRELLAKVWVLAGST